MVMPESTYRSQVIEEVERIPPEYLASLLQILRAYRESVTLPTTEESFSRGWQEAMRGDVYPVEELWTGMTDDQ